MDVGGSKGGCEELARPGGGGAMGGAASDGCAMKAEQSGQHASARCEHAQGAAGGMVVTGLEDESWMVGYGCPQLTPAPACEESHSALRASGNGCGGRSSNGILNSRGASGEVGREHEEEEEDVMAAPAVALPWCKESYVRIMVQAMRELGYRRSADSLEEEAGVRLKSRLVTELETAVMKGKWQQVDALAASDELGLSAHNLAKCRMVVKRQEYLELLEQQDLQAAMQCLQEHITPLASGQDEVHELARLLVCGDAQELYAMASWEGSGSQSRRAVLIQVQACLPSSSVVPPARLQTLLTQSLEHQMKSCTRYNDAQRWTNLLEDCRAGDELVPRRTRHVLEHHEDEVWHIQFSHCGHYLASGSKDKTVIIWSLYSEPLIKHHLKAHTDSVSFVAWSEDDKWLLSGGNDLVVKLWDTSTGQLIRDFMGHTEAVTAIAWLDKKGRFVTGSYDKQLITWNIQSSEPEAVLQGQRVTDMAVSKDGRHLVIITPEKKVKIFALPAMSLLPKSIPQQAVADESITSVSISHDSRYLLLNVSSYSRPEVQLWDLEERTRIQKYKGHKQGRYVIRSAFGGNRDAFVVCGSEDSQVFLWHRESGSLVRTLSGHSATINSVTWNPTDPSVFASASDDTTIRVWGP